MINLLAEPSCYVFALAPGETSIPQDVYGKFWSSFEYLRSLAELNDSGVYLTKDLSEAAQGKFPYYAATSRTGAMLEALGVVVRFLDKRAVSPLFEYRFADSVLRQDVLSRGADLYADDDIWLAWCDLLAQVLQIRLDEGGARADMISAHLPLSCIPEDVVSMSVGDTMMAIRACRPDKRSWPSGFLDPDVFARMCRRPKDAGTKSVWEDSGHQPSVPIKRALVRVANKLNEFVIRVGSTYYNPALVETCKLQPKPKVNEIEFRISDGKATLKGCYTTIAGDADEQQVAFRLLDREFRLQCVAEGFSCAAGD